jgi:hypothetical protein
VPDEPSFPPATDPESLRLEEDAARRKNWKRWGPYLSERQWGTVREDYSEHGTAWEFFPHEHARSRVYRWGEDGLLGITDRECRLCFSVALWNERDPILKERLFGLTGKEGNHGEDVKECYYYLDSTPTHSYMKALYKYPHAEYPYARLLEENRNRSKDRGEVELLDTGVFDGGRYFDVFAEYAKPSTDDILIRLTIANRGPETAVVHVLPTLWYRNGWSWGRTSEGYWARPHLERHSSSEVRGDHESLGRTRWTLGPAPDGAMPELWFTNNETDTLSLWGVPNATPYVKNAFHARLVHGRTDAIDPSATGTKAAAHYRLTLAAGSEAVLRLRLTTGGPEIFTGDGGLGAEFDALFVQRQREADAFYDAVLPAGATGPERGVMRQAYAGLLWSKQFYYYVVGDWLEGDPAQPAAPDARREGRNQEWRHLHNRDVISMPDKWEYPWYAAWDLAFHMLPFADIDPEFAKSQLVLFLREWYMHPNGQIPAYEWNLGDVNPPVHAWAVWRTYKITGPRHQRDRLFLERCFQKLLINFTWWVNRKDILGKNVFGGGFLGLDNIGVFDRSRPLPTGGHLEQADGTAWMAFYCTTMLNMALELASEDPAYEDVASKFFEHFVAITDAMNRLGGDGLWDDTDGFYYDKLHVDHTEIPLRIRSLVGVIPLFAVEILEQDTLDKLPGFRKRLAWFLNNRQDLAQHVAYMDAAPAGTNRSGGAVTAAGEPLGTGSNGNMGSRVQRLLAIPSRERLVRVLRYVLDEKEFLSPYGVRALSRVHDADPFRCSILGEEYRISYTPGESDSDLFGGNSNWRGPIWFPLNYLLVESLERYHHFYGDSLRVECPTGSGRMRNLSQVAQENLGAFAASLPARRARPASRARRRQALRRRSALEGPSAVLRVLPR